MLHEETKIRRAELENTRKDVLALEREANAELIEKIWAMPIGLRLKALVTSVIQVNSKDTSAIVGNFCYIVEAMARQHNAPMKLSIADQLRHCAAEIERHHASLAGTTKP